MNHHKITIECKFQAMSIAKSSICFPCWFDLSLKFSKWPCTMLHPCFRTLQQIAAIKLRFPRCQGPFGE